MYRPGYNIQQTLNESQNCCSTPPRLPSVQINQNHWVPNWGLCIGITSFLILHAFWRILASGSGGEKFCIVWM